MAEHPTSESAAAHELGAEVAQRLAALEDQVAQQAAQLTEQAQHLAALQGVPVQLAALQSQVAALQTLDTRVDALAQDQGFEQEQQTDDAQELREVQERIADLEHEIDSQAQQLTRTQEQLTALRGTVQASIDAVAGATTARAVEADHAPGPQDAAPAPDIARRQSVEDLDR